MQHPCRACPGSCWQAETRDLPRTYCAEKTREPSLKNRANLWAPAHFASVLRRVYQLGDTAGILPVHSFATFGE